MKGFFSSLNQHTKIRLNYGLLVWSILALILVLAGLQKWWTDSEMWSAVATGDFFAGKPYYFFGIKPLFHFITWGNFQIARLFDTHPMITGRLAWGVVALLIMVLCDQLLIQRRISEWGRFSFQLLLFGTSTWVFRSS